MRFFIKTEVLGCYRDLPQTFTSGMLHDLIEKKYNKRFSSLVLNTELKKMQKANMVRRAPAKKGTLSRRWIKNFSELQDYFLYITKNLDREMK